MINRSKITAAATGAIKYIFNPSSSDNVLILTDRWSMNIAQSFNEAFKSFNSDVVCYTLEDELRPIQKVPAELADLLINKTIVLNIIKALPEEIPFRIKWLFKIEENKKIRTAHMPGINEDMLLHSVYVNFGAMRDSADFLLNLFAGAVQLHITTKEGTNLKLGIKERIFSADIGVEAGGMCNLPCGEVYCAPIETEANGVIVFNASIGDIGLLNQPLTVHLKNGKIIKLESEDKLLVKKVEEFISVDEDAARIGEIGIGVNPGARITGNMLEDEKSAGTAHIAFGNNEDFPGGGKNKSQVHRDYLFCRPTIQVSYKDKTSHMVLRDGILLHS